MGSSDDVYFHILYGSLDANILWLIWEYQRAIKKHYIIRIIIFFGYVMLSMLPHKFSGREGNISPFRPVGDLPIFPGPPIYNELLKNCRHATAEPDPYASIGKSNG